jgi:outer membrane receptor protein involved in Fe transport
MGFNPVDDKTKEGNVPLSSSVNFSATHRKGNFAALVAGQSNTAQEIDNNGDLLTDRVNSKNLGGTAKLTWYDVLGEKSSIDFMGRAIYEKRKGGSFETYDDIDNGLVRIDNALDEGSEHITTERYEGGLGIEKEFASRTLVKAMANIVSHSRDATNGAAWEGVTVPIAGIDDIAKPFLTNERTIVGEVNVAQPIGDINNTVLAGVQIKRADIEENIGGGAWVERYFQDVGLFIQDEWDIVDKLGIVAGLRYDMHKSEDKTAGTDYDENAVNPRASIRFTPFDELVTRFSWGMGFRVPGDFAEDAHLCASAPTIIKPANLTPERAMSFNLSADFAKDRLSAGISLFRTNIEDKLALEDEGSPNTLIWQNVEGKAFTQGLELSAGYELDFLELGGSYVLNQAQYEDEQEPGNEDSKNILRSPLHTASVDVGLFSDPAGEGFADGWRLDLGFELVGSMFIWHDVKGELVETDPYPLLDARVNKRINKIGMDIYVAAENLTNTVQERDDDDVADAAMVYAPLYGTTVSVGFKKDF